LASKDFENLPLIIENDFVGRVARHSSDAQYFNRPVV
jgi:hypothetical protein